MQAISYELFSGRVKETFSVALGDSVVEMTLNEATRHASAGGPPSFSLYFKSASQAVLPQAVYAFSNPATGPIDIFIVPISRDAAGVVYEAVFT